MTIAVQIHHAQFPIEYPQGWGLTIGRVNNGPVKVGEKAVKGLDLRRGREGAVGWSHGSNLFYVDFPDIQEVN